MPTLVQRLREVTATESDDFFSDDTLAYYLTKAKQQVVNTYLRLERSQKRSFRALDLLRKKSTIALTQAVFQPKNTFFVAVVDTDIKALQYNYLLYGGTTPLAEIKQQHLHDVELGNVLPTKYESYYIVKRGLKTSGFIDLSTATFPIYIEGLTLKLRTVDGVEICSVVTTNDNTIIDDATELALLLASNKTNDDWTVTAQNNLIFFETNSYEDVKVVYTNENVIQATGNLINRGTAFHFLLYENKPTKSVEVNYVGVPVPLTVSDTNLIDLPDRLDNAVIYGGAGLLLTQESANNPQANVVAFVEKYTNEVNLNAY